VVEARITVHGEGAEAGGGGLAQWLRREPELRGRVALRPAAAEPGTLAASADIVVSVLGNSAILALARAVRTWLEHRKPVVEVELDTPRGRLRYKLSDDPTYDNAELVRRLTELMREPDGSTESVD